MVRTFCSSACESAIFTRLAYNVTFKSDLASLVRFMEGFFRAPMLHEIRNVSIKRESNTQRQPNQPRRMGQHALDGEVGLARVGGPEHRGDAVATGTRVALPRGTERDGHRSLRRRTDRTGASLKPKDLQTKDLQTRTCEPKHLQAKYLYHNVTEAKG